MIMYKSQDTQAHFEVICVSKEDEIGLLYVYFNSMNQLHNQRDNAKYHQFNSKQRTYTYMHK